MFSAVPNWLLYSTGNVTVNGPGRDQLIVNGGLSSGAAGLPTLAVKQQRRRDRCAGDDQQPTFREGRAVPADFCIWWLGWCLRLQPRVPTVSSVAFINCEAAGVGNGVSNVNHRRCVCRGQHCLRTRPNFIFTDVQFTGNRTVHGTAASASTSPAGGGVRQ